jgi:hypothetical protein
VSETGDLLAVVGELDRELVRLHAEDPAAGQAAREAAATLIPALRDPDTVGWYDRLLSATGAEPQETDLATAVRSLAAPTASEATVARRLVVAGAVARAFPSFRPDAEGDERDAVLLALSGPGILEGGPTVEDVEFPVEVHPDAAELHEHLMDEEALPDAGSLRDFLRAEPRRHLLQAAILRAPPPCSSMVVPVVTTLGTQVALAVVTEVCVSGTTFAEATSEHGLLNPVTWAQSDWWCEMTPAPGEEAAPWDGPRRFLERVALDCDPPGVFPVAVWLDVSERWVDPGGETAAREYAMSSAQPQPANGAVSIDEGSLVVRNDGDHVRVETTKRVEFTVGIEEEALAVLTCALGYGALAAEFALLGLGGEAHEQVCTGGTTPGLMGRSAPASFDPVDGPRRAVVGTARECAAAAGDALAGAAAGDMTGPRLASEMARSVRRTVTAASHLAALALVVADPPPVLDRLEAGPFSGGVAGAGPLPRCRPAAPRPLRSLHGHLLDPARLAFARDGREVARGDVLDPGSRSFSLRVRTEGMSSGVYRGDVDLVEVDGGQTHAVPVLVVIP